jgi:hypothetical protein
MEQQDKQQPALQYEEPKIVDYGSLQDLTAALSSGAFTDASFPSHTPQSLITFSS